MSPSRLFGALDALRSKELIPAKLSHHVIEKDYERLFSSLLTRSQVACGRKIIIALMFRGEIAKLPVSLSVSYKQR